MEFSFLKDSQIEIPNGKLVKRSHNTYVPELYICCIIILPSKIHVICIQCDDHHKLIGLNVKSKNLKYNLTSKSLQSEGKIHVCLTFKKIDTCSGFFYCNPNYQSLLFPDKILCKPVF